MLGFSMLGSFITAFEFAASSSGKFQISTLLLPSVSQIAFIASIAFGILLSPLMYWCLRDKNLIVVLPIIYSLAFILTTLLCFIHPRISFCGAFVFWIISLLVVKYFVPVQSTGVNL
jgi:branched-subunit amino acid ABC-type transport system permease component